MNRYVVTSEKLARWTESRAVYDTRIAGGAVRATLAAFNADGSELAIVLAQESRATASMFSPGSLSAGSIQRSYSVSIRNPKTGDEIKRIGLGQFKPAAAAMAKDGSIVWLSGEEMQLGQRQIRAYQARAGALAFQRAANKGQVVVLAEAGFVLDGQSFGAGSVAAAGPRVHASGNPYSIAEFSVNVAGVLHASELAGQAVGVVSISSDDAGFSDLVEAVASSKLAATGLTVVERKRIKELLQEAQFQNLGLTEARGAAELGKMANAQLLLFGEIRVLSPTVSLLSVRLTQVETGTLRSSAQLECRDCSKDDIVQGLGWLVSDWIEREIKKN